MNNSNKTVINFENTYASLPDIFYQSISPSPVKDPKLIIFNRKLGKELGMDTNKDNDYYTEIFSGNTIPSGASPLAQRYAGHQFGNFVPQLGDGRAILLGEIVTANNNRFDIQLKGSGKTEFSRGGDGRSALGPVIREYLISEAMHVLKIPTTRALSAVATGEQVFRETPLPGGILTRVAGSHLRVGTFEYFASRQLTNELKIIADYTINRHYSEANESKNIYLTFLELFAKKQASLIAKWMGVGFIHGVMNTDNTSISGETIDYGPCAFMDNYDPSTVFSSIDRHGRYAFGNQPQIAQWNLASLAGCLLPLIDNNEDKAKDSVSKIIEDFSGIVNSDISEVMCSKIGLNSKNKKSQESLKNLLALMKSSEADYTLAFRYLGDYLNNENESSFKELFTNKVEIEHWLVDWLKLINAEESSKKSIIESMQTINPIYIPRNHLVERAIKAGVNDGDYSVMFNLSLVLETPYKLQEVDQDYMNPPQPSERVLETFCGT